MTKRPRTVSPTPQLNTRAGRVTCLYCSADIAAAAFVPWSTGSRLSSATCAGCGRRVTLTSDSLVALTSIPELATP